jgi:AsmA protein
MKRAAKIIGILILILLVVAIALPFLVNVNSFRPTIETQVSSALGRKVTIGNLKLSILTGSVSADDLAIADDPAFGKSPFVTAKALNVGVEVIPLVLNKTLHVTDLTLDRPQIVLLRTPAGKWNFSSLGGSNAGSPARDKAPASADPKGSATDQSLQNLSVAKLNVNNGQVSIGDANAKSKPHVYDNVNVTVRNFSFSSQFPFTVTADLPGGGNLKLDGTAGPINPNDAAQTPLEAKLDVKRLDLAASGFVDPSSGIAGLADFDGTVASDGRVLRSNGTMKADKLKMSAKGSPAGRPVEVRYATDYNLQSQSGTLSRADVAIGKALAQLTGNYETRGEATLVNMKLNAQNMPVDDLEAMLPALGVVLPSGSSLKGGTLSTALAISGSVAKPVITGPIKLVQTKLAGFNLGSKLSAINALSGAQTGSDTSIQNFSTDAHVAPDGVRTENVDLIVPALGTLTGTGTISPAGALNYHMTANLAGTAPTGLSQIAGLGGKGGSIPFFIQGTTSDPKFVPDVQGILNSHLKSGLQGNKPNAGSAVDAITGLFGKKKKPNQ